MRHPEKMIVADAEEKLLEAGRPTTNGASQRPGDEA